MFPLEACRFSGRARSVQGYPINRKFLIVGRSVVRVFSQTLREEGVGGGNLYEFSSQAAELGPLLSHMKSRSRFTTFFLSNNRSKVAISHITINKDGSKEELLVGTVNYGKGCEPEGGHKPIYILGTTGVMRPSEAVQLATEMTPEQINAHLQCFSPEGVKLLEAAAK